MLEQATQMFAAISFLVVGVSHLAQSRGWVTFYQKLAAWGTFGAFLEGFLILNFGAIIVAFHNVWHGPATVLTVIGWAHVLKGAGRFVVPQLGLRVIERVNETNAWRFQVGGVLALMFSGFLWWVRFGT